MESTVVQVSEPGRTPLCLQLHRPLEIGRDRDGLLLADAMLSRRHLRLSSVAGRVTVEDLGSTNGTLIDGVPVRQPTPLMPGQSVTFGSCRLEVVSPVEDVKRGDDKVRRTSIDIVAAAAGADRSPMVQTGSGTLTIVFSDIEGSTRRAELLGDEAWMELLSFHNRLVRRQVERASGYEVKAQGDGFMWAFPSARSAILCSMETCGRWTYTDDRDQRMRCGYESGCTPVRRSRTTVTCSASRWCWRPESPTRPTAVRSWCRRWSVRSSSREVI